jgi:hypothetical protein
MQPRKSLTKLVEFDSDEIQITDGIKERFFL